MKVIVHRGGQQVGGTIIEISTDNCKVFLDLGSSLYGSKSCELSRSKVRQLTGMRMPFFTLTPIQITWGFFILFLRMYRSI